MAFVVRPLLVPADEDCGHLLAEKLEERKPLGEALPGRRGGSDLVDPCTGGCDPAVEHSLAPGDGFVPGGAVEEVAVAPAARLPL